MTNRWILGICQIFILVYCLHSPKLYASRLDAYLVVRWEGSALHELNLSTLDSVRKKFPDMTMIHLINPAYFQDNPLAAGNLETMQKYIGPQDEVGLLLVPNQNIIKAADVIPIKKPTYWSYTEELCAGDCGQQIPVTVYSRTDVSKIFWAAHSALKDAGFSNPTSYAVQGWISPAGLSDVAQGLGYANDLTAVDAKLVKEQLKEYPIGEWLKSAPPALSTPSVAAWTQVGGVMEFNSDEDVVARFESFYKKEHDPQAIFALSVSQENLFLSRLRVERSVDGLRAKAKLSGDELVFRTMGPAKTGRPIAKKGAISRKL